jgi:hypothetical protein
MANNKQNIEYIYAGINYIRKNGTSKASVFNDEFKKKHPEIETYYGDLRREKTVFKKVYKLLTYNYNGINGNKWKSTYAMYIEK